MCVIAEAALTSWLGAHHYQTLNYCPWTTDSVQRPLGDTVAELSVTDQSAFRGNPYTEWAVHDVDVVSYRRIQVFGLEMGSAFTYHQ